MIHALGLPTVDDSTLAISVIATVSAAALVALVGAHLVLRNKRIGVGGFNQTSDPTLAESQ
jgi:hypothetical protein